jgi:hypothetical protein
MGTKLVRRMIPTLGALALLTLVSAQASAATIAFHTVRNALTNVDDAAGRWQHEGGDLLVRDQKIGHYAITRRVTFGGTDQQNTAMVTMTLFFYKSGSPPMNLTLQGDHDFSSGKYIGSVSAASSTLLWLVGKAFAGDAAANTLTITY